MGTRPDPNPSLRTYWLCEGKGAELAAIEARMAVVEDEISALRGQLDARAAASAY